jgi:sigma-B regulation protein RsbU (phosphoserine phosphatase)
MPPRDNRHGLAFKLALLILSCTAVIFISAFTYNYLYTRDLILQETRSQAAVRTQAAINRIETILQGVEKVPLYLSRALGTQALSASSIERQVEDLLEANGDVLDLRWPLSLTPSIGKPTFTPLTSVGKAAPSNGCSWAMLRIIIYTWTGIRSQGTEAGRLE